jgi:putative ABC transport system permease protein
MLKIALRSVLLHKLRLTLTAIAIVLGVAFVSGTFVFTDSIKASFDDLFSDVNSQVDFYVRGTSEFGTASATLEDSVVDAVGAIDGIDAIVPSVDGIAQLIDKEGEPIGGAGPPTLGFSYLPEGEPLSPIDIREGDRWPTQSGQIVIDTFAAEANELVVGDVVDVITPVGVEPFEIVGLATFGDAENLLGATLTVFEYAEAQRVFDMQGMISSISLTANPGVDKALLQASIADVLPDQVEIVTAEEQTDDELAEVDEGVGFINTILLVIAGVAVFVGAFIIQNTFRIIVAQRTKELAMLRAVGATGRQVTFMVTIEALVVALVASAIGIGVGILFAIGIKAAFTAFGFGFPGGPLTIKMRTIVVGMLVGVIVTLISAVLPARKAAKIPPIAALRDIAKSAKDLSRRLTAGLIILGLGVVLLGVGLFLDLDNAIQMVGFGALLTFVGVSVLAPLFARWFARHAGKPLPRFAGTVGRLAQENAMRKPRRTAATASSLMIGVALVSVIAVFSASAKAGVSAVFEEDFSTDYQVALDGFSDPRVTGLSPALTDDLRDLDELAVVARMRIGEYRLPDDPAAEKFLIGADGGLDQVINLDITEGDFADFGDGTALLLEDEAELLELGVGDTITIEVPSGATADLAIVGVFAGDALGAPLVVTIETYEQYISFRLDRFIFALKADTVSEADARAAVDAVAEGYPNANVTNTEELIGEIEAQIDSLLNLLVVLLGFAIIIALLGIVNTLVLSVSERKREIGLLRAVGMSRKQVRYLVRWESLLIAVFGGVLGLVVGTALGVATVTAIGQGLKLAIPTGQLITYVVVAGIGGVIAAIAPARRAAKTNVLEAISYE